MRYKYLFLVALIISLATSSCLLFQPNYKKIWVKNSKHKYDVIIVPGIPFNPPTWNSIMKMRVHWSVYLYKRGITQNVIYSGSAVHTPYNEAKIMALYATALGMPEDRIFVETMAEHGSENLYFSLKMAKENGFSNIALATDPYQGSLMFKHNRKFDLNLPFLPVIFDTLFTLELDTPSIDFEKAYVSDFVPLIERVGKVERYQNSMGRRVKKMIKAEKKANKEMKKEVKSIE